MKQIDRQYYRSLLVRKRIEYGERFNSGALEAAEHFAPYLHSDVRIKVRRVYPSGEVYERTGTVGVTTGWMPAFLLMARRSAHGSSDVLGKDDQIVAVQNARGRYEATT